MILKLIPGDSLACAKTIRALVDTDLLVTMKLLSKSNATVWKVSKHGVFSGPYFAVFSRNTEKYRPEKNSVLGHFSFSLLAPSFVTSSQDFHIKFVESMVYLKNS